jgi:S1-C subfamily serine protease
MHRSALRILLVAFTVACGSSQSSPKLSARDISSAWSRSVVGVQAGDSKAAAGIILDGDGLIATTLHTIEGESTIEVTVAGEPAPHAVTAIVGFDKAHGLALVRIVPTNPLVKVQLGDSSAVSAGDRVVQLSPWGVLDGSITRVRPLSSILTILEVSAANPKEWTGPIFNENGEVIALSAAFVSQPGVSTVIAVPVNYLRPMIQQQTSIAPDDWAQSAR